MGVRWWGKGRRSLSWKKAPQRTLICGSRFVWLIWCSFRRILDGSVRSHIDYPSWQNVCDPISEEGWRRKSGATETLTSPAVWCNHDIVRRRAIPLRWAVARSAWLSPSSLLSVLSADGKFWLTQSTNGGSQGVRCKTYRSWILKRRTESRLRKCRALNKMSFCEVALLFLMIFMTIWL